LCCFHLSTAVVIIPLSFDLGKGELSFGPFTQRPPESIR
jgi:hypothetical protein